MTRYRLLVEYDGTPFMGWQRQKHDPSVQAALEAALARWCGETPVLTAAGRTDAGVHALGQVAHFDLDTPRDPATIMAATNAHLRPASVAIRTAEAVGDDFHARFSATCRHYLYRILNRNAPPVLDAHRVWHVIRPLDVDAMHQAALILVGQHDFTSFRATRCQAASPVKTLDALTVTKEGEEIHICARARSFLHHQIRNFAGTLEHVGSGKWTPEDVRGILNARDRSKAGPTAPPQGLYLVAVDY
ncbi:MAG: tRNA pseudouridine(38-40) synthase TruA [Pseudomonadota bacterium]|nr:tRNA pseudouridine(38-40) synthase TruA [Pseudomonadota bacterium]